MKFEYDLVNAAQNGSMIERVFHWFRAREILKGLKEAKAVFPNLILEFGCGTGHVLSILNKAGFRRICGFDVSPANLEKAAQYMRNQLESGQVVLASDLKAISRESYQLVLLINVLEYVSSVDSILDQIEQIAPCSPLFVSYANSYHPIVRFSRLRAFLGRRRKKDIEEDEPQIRLSAAELESKFKERGYKPLVIFYGLGYVNKYWIFGRE